jgi:predicted transcriptional regulator
MASRETERAVLLSVHPQWASAIADGSKTVEFRRTEPKQKVSVAIIYATSPVQAVVGTCMVAGIERGDPQDIWRRHGASGQIDRTSYLEYFRERSIAVAIKLESPISFARPRSLRSVGWKGPPPQSFGYVHGRPFRTDTR